MNEEKKYGVFVGRMQPMHLGHEKVIKKMIQLCGVENSLIIIGSSKIQISNRNFFSFEERLKFIKEIFPNIQVLGLPDYPKDNDWFQALDTLINSKNLESKQVIFFGGNEIDMNFFIKDKRNIYIVDRYKNNALKISATEVRDALIQEKSLGIFLNPKIEPLVLELFKKIRVK